MSTHGITPSDLIFVFTEILSKFNQNFFENSCLISKILSYLRKRDEVNKLVPIPFFPNIFSIFINQYSK